MPENFHEEDWREQLSGSSGPDTLDDYEGPEDDTTDPRDEYDRDNASGYDLNWIF